MNLGIDVIDAEIEVSMFLIKFPWTDFGMQGRYDESEEKNDDEGKQQLFVHKCLQEVKRGAPLDIRAYDFGL